jgi:hypothetical protein
MKSIFFLCAIAIAATGVPAAQITPSDQLHALAAKAAAESVEQFKEQKLKPDEFAITIMDLRDPNKLISGGYRGDQGLYPASVVKLFYLGAVHRWLEDGKLKDSPELRRAMSDMIVRSTNDATNWILEAVTDAGNGPIGTDEEMRAWAHKRNAINRYYESLGYSGVNACQKTFIEGPYGRDKVFLGEGFTNRNKLTTDATARLLAEIALGQMVSPGRSKQMMELLKRDPTAKSKNPDDQNWGFSAMALPEGSKLWAKSGWTSTARNDVAYMELPDGRKLVVCVFTTNHGSHRQILPAIVAKLLNGMKPNQ